MDIRWLTINQPTSKWTRRDQGRGSTEGSTAGQITAELPAELPAEPPAEPPPEPLLHQTSIQKIAKEAGLRQQIDLAEASAQAVEDATESSQGRKLRPRGHRYLLNS